ncbi:aspartate--tRNA(Asn) ligase [Candidatus Falkowbacteria bacterium]|nr:aspartate--tRNA(Asn) ligase [Candidatus Falkowbacteria bacterium]
MVRTLNIDCLNSVGQDVLVKGWIKARRDMGKIVFLDMRDRSGLLQIVIVPKLLDVASRGFLEKLKPEFCLSIVGTINKREKPNLNLETGEVELLANRIDILAEAEVLPWELGAEMKMDTFLDHLPLNYRDDKNRAIFKIQAEITKIFRDYLVEQGFTEIQFPKLISSAPEGGANVFTLDYFGAKAFLAQSPQLYKQIMVGVFERVFCIGTVFRAEKHNTNRHINEYTSLDFEMGFIEDPRDVLKVQLDVLRAIIKNLQEKCSAEFELLKATFPNLPVNVPILKLREAQALIKKEFGEDCTKEPDFEPHQERWLGEYAKRTWNSDFVIVTHYPTEKRPFYIMDDANDVGFTKSFDILFRGCEIVTGGQRLNDCSALVEKIKKFGLKSQDFSFYLEAFKYGMPPEGGTGMGLERLTWQMLGLDSIKQATLFPRDQGRIDLVLEK